MRDEQGAYRLSDFLLELRSSSAETVDIYLPNFSDDILDD